MDTLPNGWPQPTFMSVDEDGCLCIEWCFPVGVSMPETHRVSFFYMPTEGPMALLTADAGQVVEQDPMKVCAALDGMLRGTVIVEPKDEWK